MSLEGRDCDQKWNNHRTTATKPMSTSTRAMSKTAATGTMMCQGSRNRIDVRSIGIGEGMPTCPASSGSGCRVSFQESDIPGIGLESDVEEVADERDGADSRINQDVRHHSGRHGLGDLVVTEGDQHQRGLDEPGQHVAADRQQAEQGIEADGDPRAGDVEGPVHQPGEPLEIGAPSPHAAEDRNRWVAARS